MERPASKTSKYRCVYYNKNHYGSRFTVKWRSKVKPWVCEVCMPMRKVVKTFANEREAAIYADIINLKYNLGRPLNILKPKIAA